MPYSIFFLDRWDTSRKISKESIELQRATAALSKKQLEILEREDKTQLKAKVKLDLVKEGSSSFKFYVENISDQDAKNVNFKLLLKNEKDSPIIASQAKEKLPIPVLSPGSDVSLIAALHLGSPTAYNALVSWENPDGTKEEYETFVSL
jgi:hypothetical protein